MKLRYTAALINLLCFTAFPVLADDAINQYNSQQSSQSLQDLVKYFQNLGGYIGYDVTKSPTDNNTTISQTLLNGPAMQLIQGYMFNTFLGAIPVNAFNAAFEQLIPTEVPGATYINPWANKTYSIQGYNSSSSAQQGKVAVTTGIDQQGYQPDPVNQAILNILGTPDNSYCMNNDGSAWIGCSQAASGGTTLIPGSSVTANVIGPIPSTFQYYTYQYNQGFLSQLNSNALTGPLMYSSQQNTSNNPPNLNGLVGGQGPGLTAQNQAQEAANFIRYVSGSVTPIPLPNLKTYDTLYNQAGLTSTSTSAPTLQQVQARSILDTYFTTLRTYAAQSSVGISNLYFIMSKRLPQDQSDTGQAPASQALSEFNMATWRLYNPNMGATNQWINQINNASPATIQKEMVTLLAEINYQLYLDRQIQERILLTNSIMLLQNTKASQPSPTLVNTSSTSSQSQ